jgi:hypothetical protein
MNRVIATLTLLTVVPSSLAHGEQVLALPASNAAALICFFIFSIFLRERVLIKLVLYALLCLGIAISWTMTVVPQKPADFARYTSSYIFVVGFGIPAAITLLGWAIIRLLRSHHNNPEG